MSEKRTVYGVWEDDPSILHYYGDGSARGYVHDGKDWTDANPAEVSVKGRVISEEDFKRRFADIGLPSFRK
jgi:hypothetical protein